MARRATKGMDNIEALETNQRLFESNVQRLKEQLEEAERQQRENALKLQEAKIKNVGEKIQPYVVQFNTLNLNIFDFLNDVSGALERGEVVLVSGKEYRKKQETVKTADNVSSQTDAQAQVTNGAGMTGSFVRN